MNSWTSYFYFLVMPLFESAIVFGAGYLFLRRARITRSFAKWSIGISLSGAALLSVLGVILVTIRYSQINDMSGITILFTPFIPVSVITVATTLIFSGITVWGNYSKAFSEKRRLVTNINKYQLWPSSALLAGALVSGLLFVLPYIHLLPYREFSSMQGLDENRQKLTVQASKYFSPDVDEIIVVTSQPWPQYDAQFKLHLDWRGSAKLIIRRARISEYPEQTATFSLPFKKSVYHFENGILIEN